MMRSPYVVGRIEEPQPKAKGARLKRSIGAMACGGALAYDGAVRQSGRVP
jgi:hypothetical protein